VKYGYVIVTATVDSQRDVTHLVQLPSFFHPGQQQTRERVQLACALKRGQQSVMLMSAAVFSPDVCFPESCHTGRCVYDGGHLLNQRMHVEVTALIVFTQYIASTLC